MPSKQDQYLQFLIDSYRKVYNDIQAYQAYVMNTGLVTNEEKEAHDRDVRKRNELLVAMGQEFPALWDRFLNLKARDSKLLLFDLDEMGRAEKILRSSDPPEMKYD
jgi:hypothetical protein